VRNRFESQDRTSIVIEFEPLVAGRLLARATRSLALGALAAGLLMLTAVLFWRATLRQEADARTMEEQRRLSTLGELSAVLAHEIRNPLASLKGHAQLLAERTSEDAAEQKRVNRIVAEAQRLEDLTVDLLDFVRTGPLDLAPVNVQSFLQSVVSTSGVVVVRLDTTQAPESWILDAPRIRQVFANLLANAEEASPEGKPIDVVASEEGSSLVITFRDHGEGISEENLDRIFEPFFTTRTKGTGLGLAVARRIVELHGGTLTARSIPEGGAEFRVTLTERKS
jgi:two-component system sensor histidine kinase HydH